MPISLLLGLLAAGCIGHVNGVVTLLLSVPSFVTTLGTLFLVNGLTLTISSGAPVTPAATEAFAQVFGGWGYSEILWTMFMVVILHIMLRMRAGACTPSLPVPTKPARVRPASTSPG